MIRVALIEDNNDYRRALHHLLSFEKDIEVVYSANDCKDVTKAIRLHEANVVIMDIELAGASGINCLRDIRNMDSPPEVFMLTTFEDNEKIFESIKAGAAGYLLKSDPPEEIASTVRKVYKGESVLNGVIARKVLQYFAQKENNNQHKLDEYHLTSREKEILELLMKGLSYKEIANACFIGNATVFTHVRNIYSKLDVHSRGEISNMFNNN
jgi:DNA-binding NarL/FixJ family response regulator